MKKKLRELHHTGFLLLFTLLSPTTLANAQATDPPQKETPHDSKREVARLRVDLFYATNAELPTLNGKATKVPSHIVQKLQHQKSTKFQNYALLGTDEQPIWQIYQNWAMPMKPSEEILISFEATGRTADRALRLDLEYWQSRQMVAKFDPVLREGKTFYILGPEWRNGRLIIGLVATKFSL